MTASELPIDHLEVANMCLYVCMYISKTCYLSVASESSNFDPEWLKQPSIYDSFSIDQPSVDNSAAYELLSHA
jgi:hypothetical protein